MLDINLVREQPDLLKKNERKRNKDPKVVNAVLKLDGQWRIALKTVETLKHIRNVVSEEINKARKSKDEKIAQKKIKEMKTVAEDIRKQEENVKNLLEKRDKELLKLGNVMHPDVPYGKDDSENVELKKIGKIPSFNFKIKNHVEILEQLDLVDFDASAITSGNGFYFLKGQLALLNQALLHFAINFMHKKGYTYIEPPLMLRKEILSAAVDVEEFGKSIYSISEEDLSLIGTSEHALLGMHATQAIPEQELPRKYFSYSMCFRKEVGAHGINEKGLWRTHQFNKVEQFIFCKPEESNKMFDELLSNTEGLVKELGLPYRVIELCSGDLSPWKQRSYDVEVWRPTLKAYGEIGSLTNCTDYQARKLGIKVIRKTDSKRDVLHTLNNTAIATSRIMVAIIENYQTKKGTIKVPKALQPYMMGITEIGK